MHRHFLAALCLAAASSPLAPTAFALDGGTLRVNAHNGWHAFEVISFGDNPAGDGLNWSMPNTFDGVGAWLPNASTLRLNINHEETDATISEVDLDLASFQTAVSNIISGGTTGGVSFVRSAQQAYDRWSNDGGSSWINTTGISNTSFYRFCSGQSYDPNTFGTAPGSSITCTSPVKKDRQTGCLPSTRPTATFFNLAA